VAELIEQETSKWNVQRVGLMFDDKIVKEILATPIRRPDSKDKLVWMHNNSGIYSVKSGYLTIRDNPTSTNPIATSSHHINPDLWKHIWQVKTLPKIRFFL